MSWNRRRLARWEQVEGEAEEPRNCWLAPLAGLKLGQKSWNA